MRIIHVLKHVGHSNGNVNVAVDLACAQARSGDEVVVLSLGGFYESLLYNNGVVVTSIEGRWSVITALRFGVQLVRLLRSPERTCVHAHMMGSAVVAFFVCTLFRTPLITTVHNSFDPHSFLMRLGSAVVAVSERERLALIERGFKERCTTTILNGVAGSARQDSEEFRSIERSKFVVIVSGLHERKAVDDSIRAFAETCKDIPGWRLVVVGDGPDKDKLERLSTALGVQEQVNFVGSQLSPGRLLAQASVFLTMTKADPCPLSVIEARIAGCAIVATDVGGIPEILGHGRSGILVPVGDKLQASNKLRELMTDPHQLATWQERARRDIELFSVERMSAEYREVYQGL